jgi:hypothetical protein
MSESERVEPVLFDLGGVLMDFTGLRRFADLCGVEMGVFWVGPFNAGITTLKRLVRASKRLGTGSQTKPQRHPITSLDTPGEPRNQRTA